MLERGRQAVTRGRRAGVDGALRGGMDKGYIPTRAPAAPAWRLRSDSIADLDSVCIRLPGTPYW
ncbi:hypothetical protein EIJ05_12675 [Xanthomonas perforans]|nr:hypothetical protein EIJ05_12675 [Xanthomonas perforans]